ncbi:MULTISPECIES: hypothetical protein [unclassified Helicobacter]|nr:MULTISPECIES: hypothetical protein [unclassified Helicobacter]
MGNFGAILGRRFFGVLDSGDFWILRFSREIFADSRQILARDFIFMSL